MQSFIKRKNIENYRKLLEQTADEAERRVLRRLLADEEAKIGQRQASKRDDRAD